MGHIGYEMTHEQPPLLSIYSPGLEGVADFVCMCWAILLCARWQPLVCVLSHLLSYSSQAKAENQAKIERWQMVSDECSIGVVRVVCEAHSIPCVCSLCVGYSST